MQRVLVLLFTVLAATAIAAGCGGDDDSTTAGNGNATAEAGSGSETAANDGASGEGDGGAAAPVGTSNLTKAQYVKRVNALCKRNEKKQSEAVLAYREENPETLEEGGGGFEGSLQEVYLPMKEEELEELRAIGAPVGDEDKVEAFLTAFEDFVRAAKDLEGAPSGAVNRLAIRAGKLAVNYGLRECA